MSGEASNSAASDIYAFGMVMYEIYSGRRPYDGERFEDVIKDICNPNIRKRPPIPLHCPPRIAKVMSDCFEQEPSARPTAEQLDMSLKVELKVKERTGRLEALNRDLELANERIAAASAMQLQHFACMSHEIRTPLNCIIGLSSLMEETELNLMQKESMEMIISSGRLLRQIVDDVLDCKWHADFCSLACSILFFASSQKIMLLSRLDSKLESGNAQVLFEDINLQETLNTVIHLIQTSHTTVDKKLRVVTSYDPVLPEFINSDSRRIQQVLYNLLGNAIKFSKPEGNVEFGVKILPEEQRLQFSVKDFGKGIDAKDFHSIFEPFRQTETGLSNAVGGTGLGLAITKKLIEAMGGDISVDSQLGLWTEFTVVFPFNSQSVAANPKAFASKLQKTIVLFVADDKEGDTHRIMAMFQFFQVKFVHYNSMKELKESMLAKDGAFGINAKNFVCLAHEDLCEIEACELLVEKHTASLATFGPKFSVERLAKKHWRSLVETFPSVLVDKLGDLAKELRQDKAKEMSHLVSKDAAESRFSRLRILIAEDNTVNQKVLSRMLNRLGVTSIGIANDGVEAVEKEAEEPYDLVLMDLQMPRLDGIEACQRLNKRVVETGKHPLAKVIFVTAHVSDSFRHTAVENGAIGYLPKPCTINNVEEVLDKALEVINTPSSDIIPMVPLASDRSKDSNTTNHPIHSLMDGSYKTSSVRRLPMVDVSERSYGLLTPGSSNHEAMAARSTGAPSEDNSRRSSQGFL